MSGSYRKNLKRLAKRRGWTITTAPNGHLELSKDGCQKIRCSYSPRSDNALRRVEKDLDRAEGLSNTGWAAAG